MTVTAREIYDELTFTKPGDFLNKSAPDPRITFAIGGVLFAITLVWFINRVRTRLRQIDKIRMNMNIFIRVMISAAIDNDRNLFTMVKYSGTSFLFLGGIQVNFSWTLIAMVILYCIYPSLEIIRVLLAYYSVDSVHDNLTFVSNIIGEKYKRYLTQTLEPKNVYEDLGRKFHIVFMIFATQVILILFVCIDIGNDRLYQCLDGTEDCPIGGTLGSWLFFVLGIFMALVFQLGPSTNFGESIQNPAYWLHLLLEIRHGETHITWQNDMKKKEETVTLKPSDRRVVCRYMMSFLINGIGFHILVHALPLQIASASSFTGVVATAVGMLYLVDLDNTPGYTMTIHGPVRKNTCNECTDIEDTEDTDINKAINEVRSILRNLENKAVVKQESLQGGYALASEPYCDSNSP